MVRIVTWMVHIVFFNMTIPIENRLITSFEGWHEKIVNTLRPIPPHFFVFSATRCDYSDIQK